MLWWIVDLMADGIENNLNQPAMVDAAEIIGGVMEITDEAVSRLVGRPAGYNPNPIAEPPSSASSGDYVVLHSASCVADGRMSECHEAVHKIYPLDDRSDYIGYDLHGEPEGCNGSRCFPAMGKIFRSNCFGWWCVSAVREWSLGVLRGRRPDGGSGETVLFADERWFYLHDPPQDLFVDADTPLPAKCRMTIDLSEGKRMAWCREEGRRILCTESGLVDFDWRLVCANPHLTCFHSVTHNQQIWSYPLLYDVQYDYFHSRHCGYPSVDYQWGRQWYVSPVTVENLSVCGASSWIIPAVTFGASLAFGLGLGLGGGVLPASSSSLLTISQALAGSPLSSLTASAARERRKRRK